MLVVMGNLPGVGVMGNLHGNLLWGISLALVVMGNLTGVDCWGNLTRVSC